MLALFTWSKSPEILIPLASLAWLVVGVAAGYRLAAAGGSRKPRTRKVRSKTRSGGSQQEIYVGNLSYDATEKDLYRAFGEFGDVAAVRLITNNFNGKSKGYAFVQMGDRSQSEKALKALDGKDICGRKVVVNLAKSKRR